MALHDRLIEFASCLSRLANVLAGGTADLTLSARSHRDGLWTERWIDGLFAIFGEPGHCRRWWEIEVERSRRNVQIHDDKAKTRKPFGAV